MALLTVDGKVLLAGGKPVNAPSGGGGTGETSTLALKQFNTGVVLYYAGGERKTAKGNVEITVLRNSIVVIETALDFQTATFSGCQLAHVADNEENFPRNYATGLFCVPIVVTAATAYIRFSADLG